MKKLLSLMAAALLSVAMWAGANDLLWDYTEKAPQGSPDNGLYYESKVDDGEKAQNNKLNGIKLNSSGYCYFRKAAVAGTLRLGYADRKTNKPVTVKVYTWEGELTDKPNSVDEMTLIGSTEALTEYGFKTIELTAEQQNIYLCRGENTEMVLQYIQFKENVNRDFENFKIEFRTDPYSVIEPEKGLPEGVVITGTWHDGQHGYTGATLTVPVDGPVKFTLGACQFSTSLIKITKDGVQYASITNNAPCGETEGHFDQFVNWTYTGDAGTLVFQMDGNNYLPYFFAEATEITPCQIIFKDHLGNELGRVDTYEGAEFEGVPSEIAEKLPPIPDNEKLRGWFYTNGKRAYTGDPINGNTTITAKVTPIEYATVGSVQTYNFASDIFYPWDHETVDVFGNCYYHDGTHGWAFHNGEGFKVQVAGNAIVVLTICQYGAKDGVWNAMKGDAEIYPLPAIDTLTDGKQVSIRYEQEATTLTFKLVNGGGENYLHKVVVYNVQDFPAQEDGYYKVPANDAASLLLVIAEANTTGNAKIFLPDGYYDMGETVLTSITADNISIIGESMDGTVIRNAPSYMIEQINTTATLRINKNVKNTYLQDLTLRNDLDYYHNNEGRAVCLQDMGTQTVCKNVRMISHQDTYYSNLQGGKKYFEDCAFHGTVDFICGDGSVYFKNTELVCDNRTSTGGGVDAITASNSAASDKGYVFESSRVHYAEEMKTPLPVVSFGRSWNNSPKCVFLNTVLADDLVMTKDASQQKDKVARWTLGAMNALPEKFGEFNSMNDKGEVVSPASNEVTFVLNNNEKTMETILSAEEAAAYTMEYTLGDWAATAKAEAEQVELTYKDGKWNPTEATVFLVTKDGETTLTMHLPAVEEGIIVRAANARGGFGAPAHREWGEGIDNTGVSNSKTEKIMRNGQLIIVRGDKTYNVLGAQL